MKEFISYYYLSFHFPCPYLSLNQVKSTDPGLSIGNPKALDHIKLAIHPKALETAKITV